MARLLKFFVAPAACLAVIFALGPRPGTPNYDDVIDDVPLEPSALEAFVSEGEAAHKLKPGNQAQIVWADSSRKKTEYAFVYLHGFSASQMEGDPVHRQVAREFGANLYLARIEDHGIDTTDALFFFSAERAWRSARKALAVGNAIGDKVIVISTSTGGTLALLLASRFPDKVYALINMSPNIEINNPAAFMLNGPWGLYIARAVVGSRYRLTGGGQEKEKFWNTRYRLEAVVQLQELLESTMTDETFAGIRQPSLTLYYYRNEDEQDPEVRVEAMLRMHAQLGTPDSLKKAVPIPDAGAHVLASPLASRDVEGVYTAIESFLKNELKMLPAHSSRIE